MSRKRPGWRAAEKTFRHLSAVLARKAAESVHRDREDRAATVCPDGDGCRDGGCMAARAAFRAGADWRVAFGVMRNARADRAARAVGRVIPGEGALQTNRLAIGADHAIYFGMNSFVMMVGGSGSGKSTVRSERFGSIAVVDCDEIKKEHADYDPKNPALVHDWSSAEATRRLMGFVSRGESVVFDSTGSNVDKLAMFANIARAAGMTVVAVLVSCDVETAIARDAARARTVGAAVVRESHARVAMAWPVLKTMVDRFETVTN